MQTVLFLDCTISMKFALAWRFRCISGGCVMLLRFIIRYPEGGSFLHLAIRLGWQRHRVLEIELLNIIQLHTSISIVPEL
jgi:hypothetical protein